MSASLLLAAVATPFAGAFVAPYLGKWLGARAGYVLALCFVPALLLARGAEAVKNGEVMSASLAWVPQIGLDIGLRADGFSLMFALIVSGIGMLILCYAAAYLAEHERHGRFFSYLLIFGGAMLGLVLADNLIALFVFWEMTSISSFLLIGFWDSRRASQDGATKALVITALGGLALLVSVILLALAGGTVLLSELDAEVVRASPYFMPAMLAALFAAVTKSAQLPFHLWLPTAMEAPTPVSAYLHSATMVKAGVILVAKFGFLFVGTFFSPLLLYIGLATMFWGSYLALRQEDLKALLAYSTVSQLGILMALYGAGHSFAATAHLVNHAAFKATLFMVVGIIDHETGSRDIANLSGLRRKLPFAFMLALPAALSMAGLPIFGGFISKELFYEEMLGDGFLPIFIAVTGSVMTFAYSLRFLKVFFGKYRCEKPNVHEAPLTLWLPAAPLALAVVLFGVVPLGLTGNPFTETTLATWFTDLAAPSFEGVNAEALGAQVDTEAAYTEATHDTAEEHGGDKLYLWHGITTALVLSFLTWLLGTLLHIFRDPFNRLQVAVTPGWNVNTIYYDLMEGLEYLSSQITRRTQDTHFAVQLRIFFVAFVLIGASVGWRYFPQTLSPVPFEFFLAALLIVGSVVGVLRAHSRLSAIIYSGLAGFASTLIFVLMSAPDLALTQLLIETVTVILFLSVFRFLPRLQRYSRRGPVAVIDALIASGVGLGVFTTLVAVQTPIDERIQAFFLEYSKSVGGGNNVVNVILVDFRGYDTMGEITVLSVVAVSVYALLKAAVLRPPKKEDE